MSSLTKHSFSLPLFFGKRKKKNLTQIASIERVGFYRFCFVPSCLLVCVLYCMDDCETECHIICERILIPYTFSSMYTINNSIIEPSTGLLYSH